MRWDSYSGGRDQTVCTIVAPPPGSQATTLRLRPGVFIISPQSSLPLPPLLSQCTWDVSPARTSRHDTAHYGLHILLAWPRPLQASDWPPGQYWGQRDGRGRVEGIQGISKAGYFRHGSWGRNFWSPTKTRDVRHGIRGGGFWCPTKTRDLGHGFWGGRFGCPTKTRNVGHGFWGWRFWCPTKNRDVGHGFWGGGYEWRRNRLLWIQNGRIIRGFRRRWRNIIQEFWGNLWAWIRWL